jgi:hypothetical protein
VVLGASLASEPGGGRDRLLAIGRFAAGAAGPLFVLGAYQTAAFGGPFASGYAHVADPTFAAGMAEGLLGVGLPRPSVFVAQLFGPSRGLFYLSPVLLLAVFGLYRGLRAPGTRRPAAVATVMVLLFALLSAGYYMWWGGAALGPRHLIPALPFLCLGFAWLGPGRRRFWLFVALLVVAVANQLAGTAVSPHAPPDIDLVREHVWGHFLRGEVALYPGSSNLGLMVGLRGAASLLPLLVLWALGVWTVLGALTTPAGGAGKDRA